jgi:DNA-binding response OmpR family regulator
MSASYHKVLIVEDEATLRGIIARNLSARGHEVAEADSVREALNCLDVEQPDLLLLDINLPDRTGWDLLRHLKAEDNPLPVVIVSAVRMNPERLAEFKPLAYLPKPFPLDALMRIVEGEGAEEEVTG